MRAAWAHEQAGQHRKGTDIPYFAHSSAVMHILSQFCKKEDSLIGSLLHDVVEDVPPEIYGVRDMRREFGAWPVRLVLDNTKDQRVSDWHEQTRLYLQHLNAGATDDSLAIAVADKSHGVLTATTEYEEIGDLIWQQKFGGKSPQDKLWAYSSVLEIARRRRVDQQGINFLGDSIAVFRRKLREGGSLEDDGAI